MQKDRPFSYSDVTSFFFFSPPGTKTLLRLRITWSHEAGASQTELPPLCPKPRCLLCQAIWLNKGTCPHFLSINTRQLIIACCVRWPMSIGSFFDRIGSNITPTPATESWIGPFSSATEANRSDVLNPCHYGPLAFRFVSNNKLNTSKQPRAAAIWTRLLLLKPARESRLHGATFHQPSLGSPRA